MVNDMKMKSLFSAFLLSSVTVLAAPSPHPRPEPHYARHRTHHRRMLEHSGEHVESYHPASTFKTWGESGNSVAGLHHGGNTTLNHTSLVNSAITFAKSIGYSAPTIDWKAGYVDGSEGFAYLKQKKDGIPFANAVANMGIKDGQVISWGSSFIDIGAADIADPKPTVPWDSVLYEVETQLDATYHDEANVTLEYFVKDDGSVALTHVMQLYNNVSGNYYEAFVDAHSGKLVSVTDFVAHGTFKAVPIVKSNFADGGQQLIVDPEDRNLASEKGWQTLPDGTVFDHSGGNNVFAFLGPTGTALRQSAPGVFKYPFNPAAEPTAQENQEAAITNAFYVMNRFHDVMYRYGFTEERFNFQNQPGNGRGGLSSAPDGVLVSVQDPSGTNNANFATPPDGQPGICRMFIWTFTSPRRDSAMENNILIHEYGHGVSNRLTGGGTGRCLQTLEAGGMGEGWSDTFANWFVQDSREVRDFVLGDYVTGRAHGIRRFPYSTDFATNPLTYSQLKVDRQVHNIGEVWATMLHGVYAALVREKGYSDRRLADAFGFEGNVVFMRLLIMALSMQPCNPTFIQARDAWIQADINRYGGVHKCIISRAFANRGLGIHADSSYNDDWTPLPGC